VDMTSYKRNKNPPRNTTTDILAIKNPLRDSDPKSQGPEYPYKFKPPTKDEESSATKWLHDKYDSIQSNFDPNSKTSQAAEAQNKRSKRPDIALYSARNKHNRNSDTPNTNSSATSRNDVSTPKNLYSKTLMGNEEKDITPFEDDSKSITSNVSTAFSERIKSTEEDIFINRDINLAEKGSSGFSGSKKDDSHVLFEITLDNDRFTDNIKVYDNEEDYESFLEKICYQNDVKGDVALHLKIYILYLIKNSNFPEFRRIESLYNRLLEENYNLIMNDGNKTQLDDSLLDLVDFDSSQNGCVDKNNH